MQARKERTIRGTETPQWPHKLTLIAGCGVEGTPFTRDLGRAFRLSQEIESGMVILNSGAVGTSRTAYREIIARMVEDSAEGIILGCTEIMLLIGADNSSVPTFDTNAPHAQAAIEKALD